MTQLNLPNIIVDEKHVGTSIMDEFLKKNPYPPTVLIAAPQKGKTGTMTEAIQKLGRDCGYHSFTAIATNSDPILKAQTLSRTPARNSKTTRRNHTWVIQKKEGGRWSTLRDSGGVINIRTRSMARTISREFNNTAKKPRTFRVKKLA